ncbi:MAG: hypothetical protein ACOCSD_03455 [Halolamina sp.]
MSDSEQLGGTDLDREINVRLAFAVVAAALGIGVVLLTEVPEWIAFALVGVVGLGAPRLALYADN